MAKISFQGLYRLDAGIPGHDVGIINQTIFIEVDHVTIS